MMKCGKFIIRYFIMLGFKHHLPDALVGHSLFTRPPISAHGREDLGGGGFDFDAGRGEQLGDVRNRRHCR